MKNSEYTVRNLFFAVSIILVANQLFAQVKENTPRLIEPIWVQAEVLGLLEHHEALGVVHILRVAPDNEIHLSEGSEVLVEFVFGTRSSEGEPKLAGVKAGMKMRAEIAGSFNPKSGQWDYRIFRYTPVDP